MRILIVRHGNPDYTTDSLTDKGIREAEYLSRRLCNTKIDYFYVSPLGRARETIEPTLRKLGKEAVTLPWLREFDVHIHRPDVADHLKVCWDWLPQDWTCEPRFYDYNRWMEPEAMASSDVPQQYEWVTQSLDQLLADHGYVREGNFYRVLRPNTDTICLVCHFGLECVLLSRMLTISPMQLWQGFCAATSSVTTIYTEERREGIASFRVSAFGDISHLYMNNESPDVTARFCEMYSNFDERHD